VEIGQRLGFTTDTIDSRIEALEHDDWKATNPRAALKRAFAVFGRRAQHEVTDLTDAIARVDPDAQNGVDRHHGARRARCAAGSGGDV
jgi:hypothetical protein